MFRPREGPARRTQFDPPDEPIEPQERMSMVLKSILTCLPELTPAELYQLKEAVVDMQIQKESETVLIGQGLL